MIIITKRWSIQLSDKTLKLLFCMIFLLTILPFIYAETYEQGETLDLKISCDKINCSISNNITITAPNSTTIVSNKLMTISNGYANYTLSATDDVGVYQFFTYDLNNGSYSGSFSITPNGENATVGNAIFYIGLLAVLLFFLAITIYFFISFDNLLGRVATIGASYLLILAITFIAWNMAESFITSAPFLIDMLRILFFVLIVMAFPLLIGGFIWYFLMLWKVKEIERLMSKGMSYEESERRLGKKYK